MATNKYIISHDVGTQSNKAVLIDLDGKIHHESERSYPLTLPKAGWVEQSPLHYWEAICNTTHDITSSLDKNHEVLAMVFSTQGMGIIPVNKKGDVLYNNISWVDARANSQAVKIMNRFFSKSIFKKISGVELSGKDVIPKLLWIKEELPEVYNLTHKFLDVNGYLKFKCTGKMVAEWSGACSYGFNLDKKDWERLFFKIAGIDLNKLPDLVRSTDLIGKLTKEASRQLGLSENVKIFGGCDDTQSAAMGSGQIENHNAHIYLGTSAWIGVSANRNYKFKQGVASLQSANPASSLLVGITESAGANIEWALDKLYVQEKNNNIDVYKLLEEEVTSISPGADELIFTPWFQGERTPVTNTNLRSTVFNLGLEHTRAHIMRAMLEGIAYNLKWTIDNIRRDYKINITEIAVIGGGSQNRSWMQILSNILQVKILTTQNPKTAGALGCAMCALIGSGEVTNWEMIKSFNPIKDTYYPSKDSEATYERMYKNYRSIYSSLFKTYNNINKHRFNH